MKNELIKLANHLDRNGYIKEADYVDQLLKKNAFLGLDPLGLDSVYETVGNSIWSGGKFLWDKLGEGADAFIRNLKEELVEYVAKELGILEDGFGLEFLKNIIAGLEFGEIIEIGQSDNRCELISKEIGEALAKTTIEVYITEDLQKSLETSVENTVQSFLGLEEGSLSDQMVEGTIAISGEFVEEITTKYLTEDSEFINKISQIICDFINDMGIPFVSNDSDKASEETFSEEGNDENTIYKMLMSL